MFLNDYLMRMIMQFVVALQRALRDHNLSAAEKADSLEQAVGDAVGIDPQMLFSMDPDSMVSLLQLGDFDENLGGYVVRSMYFEADILEEAGYTQSADLRRSQADAIVRTYGLAVTPADATPAALEEFLQQDGQESDPLGSQQNGEA
jgi:hypothetical protein